MARTQKLKIINILLGSVDGKIASHDQQSSSERRLLQFTNTDDFKHLQKITAQCDAVLIGAKSLHSESGAFRVAHLRKDQREPHWFVMTKSGNIKFEHPFWKQQDIPKSIFHHSTLSSRDSTAGSSITNTNEMYDNYYKGNIFDFFKSLSQQKIKKIALLGGGELNGFFWEHNLVSELHLTLSPFVIGDKNAPQLISANHALNTKLQLKYARKKKNFLFLHYKVL